MNKKAQNQIYIEYWSLSDILTAPTNPKEHALADIGQSMRRFGYTNPMLIDERTDHLVAGYGRREKLMAMKEAGESPPQRIQVRDDGEWLVPVIRGVRFQSDDDALAYLLADNWLTEKGGWDDAALAAVLQELLEGGGEEILTGTGLSEDDLTAINTQLEQEQAEQEIKERLQGIKPRKMARVLISIPVDRAADTRPILDELASLEGIEIDYGAN